MKHIDYRHQAGVTIVELMISLLLSTILIGGVLQVFLSSSRTYSMAEALARTQENGRFALEFISQSARQAGYLEPYLLTSKRLPLAEPNCNWPSTADANCTSNGATSDKVTFILQPPEMKDDPASAARRRDCAGNDVAEDTVIANVFHIAAADANNPYSSLACTTFNVTDPSAFQTVRLVDGVENLQLLYGMSTSGDPQSVNQFVSANRVTDWSSVSAVRIAVLASSMNRASNDAANPQEFTLLDARITAPNDGLARQVFTTTVRIHNLD
ncbi:PilW family protein [Pseudomonas sp. JS3066]|jgi:type IV pilus assembly protein PilW|uniref:PilW family protein n=1 Tax=unclassified Pseudomonas TaxID=196821 RepID=UPI002E7B802F|nr:PilW family protein [Pseudomonas sp. JS3066]WVK94036.1 PilW family protein [Pseudomonas sp. JS3066]